MHETALDQAIAATTAKMSAFNADMRHRTRTRFRRAVAEYVNRPHLLLAKSACALHRPYVATIEDACVLHKRAVQSQLSRKRQNHWTYDPSALVVHHELLLVARYIRRFGERIETAGKREAA